MSEETETKEEEKQSMNENEREEKYGLLKKAISELRVSIKDKLHILSKGSNQNINNSLFQDSDFPEKIVRRPQFRTRRKLEGHFGKVYALHWSYGECIDLVSASQDGKLLIWNTETQHKKLAINLKSSWVMTCGYSFDNKFVASAGLDSMCSIYDISSMDDNDDGWYNDKAHRELIKHEGYISSAKFLNNEEILTSSGDASCILWDIEKNAASSTFKDFEGDIECLDVNIDKSLFVTGSIDSLIKLYDYRDCRPILSLNGIYTSGDIQCMRFFPDGQAFVYSSDDDHIVRLFDIRSFTQINTYNEMKVNKETDPNVNTNQLSIKANPLCMDFTKSGYYLCVGYDENNTYGGGNGDNPYCVLYNTQTTQIEKQLNHDMKVSCVQTASNGFSIATGCWDKILRIWA